MPFYRKKPVVIEAVQWTGSNINDVVSMPRNFDLSHLIVNWNGTLSIKTLEGVMQAEIGDFIICGVQGELYPCKPDIFKQTYEDIEAEAKSALPSQFKELKSFISDLKNRAQNRLDELTK